MDAFDQINRIKGEIFAYYEMSFKNESDDYEYNKMLKIKLKTIIIHHKGDNAIIEKALLVLAETTGCAEDQEIAEEIIDYLYDNDIIDKKQMDLFYDNAATGRWL